MAKLSESVQLNVKTIRSVDPASGRTLWESGPHEGLPARYDAVEGWDPLYVTAHEDRVVSASKTAIEGRISIISSTSSRASETGPR